jgi:hypothetical protein
MAMLIRQLGRGVKGVAPLGGTLLLSLVSSTPSTVVMSEPERSGALGHSPLASVVLGGQPTPQDETPIVTTLDSQATALGSFALGSQPLGGRLLETGDQSGTAHAIAPRPARTTAVGTVGNVASVSARVLIPTTESLGGSGIFGSVEGTAPVARTSAVVKPVITGSVSAVGTVPRTTVVGQDILWGTATGASSAVQTAVQGAPVVSGTGTAAGYPIAAYSAGQPGVSGSAVGVAPYPVTAATGTSTVTGSSSAIVRRARSFAQTGEFRNQALSEVTGYLPVASAVGTVAVTGQVTGETKAATAQSVASPVVSGSATGSSPVPTTSSDTAAVSDATVDTQNVPVMAFAEGSPVIAVVGASRVAIPTADAAGMLRITGVGDAVVPLSRTSGAGIIRLYGSASIESTVPRTRIRNYTSVWYLSVNEDQFPFDMDNDAEGRRQYAFNVTADKNPSSTFQEEIAYFLELSGVTYPILLGSQAAVPRGDGPFITITQTGGLRGVRVQNQRTPARERPSAQILVRAKSSRVAKDVSYDLMNRLIAIRNQELIVPAWALE